MRFTILITTLVNLCFSAKNGHLGCYQNGVSEPVLASQYLNVSLAAVEACIWSQKHSWKEGCKTFSCHLEGKNNICIPYKEQAYCDKVIFRNGGKRHCHIEDDGCGGFVAKFNKNSVYSTRDSETCNNYYWRCTRSKVGETRYDSVESKKLRNDAKERKSRNTENIQKRRAQRRRQAQRRRRRKNRKQANSSV